VRLSLKPLGAREVGTYIEHRWRAAGGQEAAPFSSETVVNVAKWSRGIPRLINSICDNALVEAFAASSRSVSPDHVRMAADGLLLIDKPVARLPVPVPPLAVPVPPPERPVAPKIVRPINLATLDRYAAPARKQSVFAWWTRRSKQG
jgi:general secretion pathway protein A